MKYDIRNWGLQESLKRNTFRFAYDLWFVPKLFELTS